MGRAPCCDKSSVKKGPWSPDEDAKLKSYIHQNGTGGNWIALPQKIGLKRCGKSCRLRWLNYLRPNIKHGGFSEEEDNIICSLYISIGSRWSIIAAQLPGRTDNDIKNYWNTRLKKKLLGKHRKEKRERSSSSAIKPYSQAAVLPPIPYYSTTGEPRFNDYASIRNLLITLGGSFSTQHTQTDHFYNIHHHHQPLIQPLPYDPIHQLNTGQFDMLNGSDHMLPLINLPDHFQHNYSHKLQGFDSVSCDDHEFINNTATSMEIMNSSIFTSNQGFIQGSSMMMMMAEEEEELCVDKMIRYPGIQ